MPKPKKFGSLSDTALEIGDRTRDLYKQSTAQLPPVVTSMDGASSDARVLRVRKRAPQSIIPRQGGKLLFLEERHNEAIEQIHWTSKVDRQDVIRAAVDEFLLRHFNGDRLSQEGERLVKEYYARTHV